MAPLGADATDGAGLPSEGVTPSDPRDRILELAIAAIDEGGEAAVRISDLVETVNVGPPVLYRAFGSREGLIVKAQAERYRRALHLGEELVDNLASAETEDDFRAGFEEVLVRISEASRIKCRRARLHVLGTGITRPELLDAILAIEDEAIDDVVPGLERAQARGWVRADVDVRTWFAWFMTTVSSWANLELHIDECDIDGRGWQAIAHAAIRDSLFDH